MNDSIIEWVILIVVLVFIFEGDPDIYDLAHQKLITELSK